MFWILWEEVLSPHIDEKMVYEEYKRFSDQALTHISSVNGAFGRENRWPYYDHVFIEFAQKNIPLEIKDQFQPEQMSFEKTVCRDCASGIEATTGGHSRVLQCHSIAVVRE